MDRVMVSVFVTLLAILALAVAGCIAVVATGDGYTQRIEAKYDIDVLSIAGKYADGTVIYMDSDGRQCAAAQAPDDVLVELSCNEVGPS